MRSTPIVAAGVCGVTIVNSGLAWARPPDWADPNTYGTPVNLGSPLNSIASEATPTLTGDELTMTFTSGGPGLPARPGTRGPGALWVSTRVSTQSPWTTPVRLDNLDTDGFDIDGSITADGLEIVFASGYPLNIWKSTRTRADAPWPAPTILPNSVNAPNCNNAHGCISADGLSLIIHRHPLGASQGDLFMSTRLTRAAPWPNVVALPPEINGSTLCEVWPCLSTNGLTLLFARYTEGVFSTADIYVSTRDTPTSPWKQAVKLPSPVINQPGVADGSPWLSPDNQRLYFASSRAGGLGSLDLWMVPILSRADFDRDRDVDADDLKVFVACSTGPSVSYDPARLPAGCMVTPTGLIIPTDFDGDLDVDQSDFGVFQQCYSGENKPADPNCVPKGPYITGSRRSDCKPSTPTADGYPWCGKDELDLVAQGSSLQVTHRNAAYNCCLDDIAVTLDIQGRFLRFQEKELLTTACDCLCCYDTTTTVEGLTPGVYRIEYCWVDEENGNRCLTKDVTVSP